jgi:hypothetical protein
VVAVSSLSGRPSVRCAQARSTPTKRRIDIFGTSDLDELLAGTLARLVREG